jgi:hypothetical protein
MLRGLPFTKLQGVWSGHSTTSPSLLHRGPAPPTPRFAPPGSSRIPEA